MIGFLSVETHEGGQSYGDAHVDLEKRWQKSPSCQAALRYQLTWLLTLMPLPCWAMLKR